MLPTTQTLIEQMQSRPGYAMYNAEVTLFSSPNIPINCNPAAMVEMMPISYSGDPGHFPQR